jgi:hypothetical protein
VMCKRPAANSSVLAGVWRLNVIVGQSLRLTCSRI